MTPCSLTSLFIIGIAVFVMAYYNMPLVELCAESCSCTPEDTEWGAAVNVQCGDRYLMSVPIKKHDKPASLLNASFNVLKNLEEDALLSYESVRDLYLHHCKIGNINEKAFQRLENLTVIDLASNRLTSISPNLFNGNQKLNKLILRSNNLGSLQWNTPILNGPSSLSFLDLQSCKLSNVSSITFSLLLNLTFLDISRNTLVLLNNDSLSSHEKLKDVNLENNPWQCGVAFQGLMCWIHSKLAPSYNRTVKCTYLNETSVIWSPENWTSLCDSESTRSVTSSYESDISTNTKENLASTPSQETDISTSKTLNSNVSHEVEADTDNAHFWVMVAVSLLLFFLICGFCFSVYKKYSTQCESDLLISHPGNDTVENECENISSVGCDVKLLPKNITEDSQLR